ncbi:uncharacterized protein LOC116114490 [Pistacia vera]|uniref:uncharacterized protein LOC116114490 n=1 Tax=Pistacia vera TaxID=55513 RepID=UPI001263168F|nr:uncharacterized protein LOC116114490 [Pistacia vera]
MVDAASRGALQNKTPKATYELLEVLTSNNYQRSNERIHLKKSIGIHEVDAYTAISAQLVALHKQLGEKLNERVQGSLPSNMVTNPCEQANAITLRSGKVIEEVESRKKDKNPSKKKGKSEEKVDEEIIVKEKINVPFVDALQQMPSYAKFLKEILSNKRKLEEDETMMLKKECSAILQKKLPPKLKDLGGFTIPCKLGIGEVKPTIVSLQLADRSIKHPRGIIEDVLVKVDKFIFPVDFVVLDMEIPLILGRPFLATGRILINVQQGKLILRVQDETVTFNVFEAMKFPSELDSCFSVDLVDKLVTDTIEEITLNYL